MTGCAKAGIQAESTIQFRLCVFELLDFEELIAKIMMRRWVVGVDFERLTVESDCSLDPAQPGMGFTDFI